MTETHNDYGVAERYDAARALPEAALDLWTKSLKGLLPQDRINPILDLGAGTGRFSMPLRDAFGCRVIAVDPFEA